MYSVLSEIKFLGKFIIPLLVFGFACNSSEQSYNDINLVDANTTQQTKRLYKQLQESSKKGFMFGHQDALSYGMGWKYTDSPGRCDVYELTGDYPGIFGWDIGHLEVGKTFNIDTVDFDEMRTNIIKAYELGAVNTVSWHPLNPITGGDTWDNTETVKHILPGGSHYEKYKSWLKIIGEFMKNIKTKDGVQVPIVWRPYHEHNGGWFWWGQDSTTVNEYVDLWKYTVHYFRDSLDIHNLLYAYSPNLYDSREVYLEKYPGDEYVDILGCDVYDLPQYGIDYKNDATKAIQILKELGEEKNKVYAFTETGSNGLENEKWWTESLLPAIDTSGVAWFLIWRNAHAGHFYSSYKGHKSALDFIDFYNNPKSLFTNEVNKISKTID